MKKINLFEVKAESWNYFLAEWNEWFECTIQSEEDKYEVVVSTDEVKVNGRLINTNSTKLWDHIVLITGKGMSPMIKGEKEIDQELSDIFISE